MGDEATRSSRGDARGLDDALFHAEARFQKLIEAAPDGIAIVCGTRFVYANQASANLLGKNSPEEVVGLDLSDVLPPRELERAARHLGRLFGGDPSTNGEPVEFQRINEDGSELTVELTSIPIEWEGKPAVLGFARDVSERKAMQARVLQADRLAAVGMLAAGVAHEINNPLTYVLVSLQSLNRELARSSRHDSETERARTRVRDALGGAERVASIVGDLRAFARTEDESLGPVDLAAVIESALKIADNQIRHRGRLIRDFGPAPPVHGNVGRLEQVFLNLIMNAVQSFAVDKPHRNEIRITLRKNPDATVTATVSDTGVGMSTATLNRIFDPFFTTKPQGSGTGLGLPICHGIVTGLGGLIDVVSEPGRGTTFSVKLPTSKDALDGARAKRSSEAPAPTLARRGRVLVIDDERRVFETLRVYFQDEHDLSGATDAESALTTLAKDSDYDAILCDVMMPGTSGVELFHAIRDQSPGLERRIVFMTGGAFTQKAIAFLDEVDNECLDKPLDLQRTRQLLRDYVRAAR